jgi:ribokinase
VARAAGALVILDPAPAAPLPDGLIALADLLTPNETELAILTGRPAPRGEVSTATIDVAARELLERGARRVLVKLGARGSRLVTASDVQSWQAFPVSAVDTTAAGDAFNGALAVALAEDRPLADAVQFATAAGAISVTRPGAQPSMPVLAEVNDLLRQH